MIDSKIGWYIGVRISNCLKFVKSGLMIALAWNRHYNHLQIIVFWFSYVYIIFIIFDFWVIRHLLLYDISNKLTLKA